MPVLGNKPFQRLTVDFQDKREKNLTDKVFDVALDQSAHLYNLVNCSHP